MKGVSFKVAQAIKEAGYPQFKTEKFYSCTQRYSNISNRTIFEGYILDCMEERGLEDCDIPTYLDVWLWLWSEYNIQICVEQRSNVEVFIKADFYALPKGFMKVFKDPEEAIASAIEYLVTNKLLK